MIIFTRFVETRIINTQDRNIKTISISLSTPNSETSRRGQIEPTNKCKRAHIIIHSSFY